MHTTIVAFLKNAAQEQEVVIANAESVDHLPIVEDLIDFREGLATVQSRQMRYDSNPEHLTVILGVEVIRSGSSLKTWAKLGQPVDTSEPITN
jgi:hypothetical protein